MTFPLPTPIEAETSETADFGDALEELFRSVLRASGRGVPGGRTQLTMSQYWVMAALAEGPLTVSEVARAAQVAVPSATRALRALQRRGFVSRRDHEDDGRLVTVSLSPRGRAVLGEKQEWVRTRQREIFEGLSASEQETVTDTLRALAHAIGEL
ncbi:MAG TPA: MarR family transcriptional regulator [Thermoleophilaceae bacterium]